MGRRCWLRAESTTPPRDATKRGLGLPYCEGTRGSAPDRSIPRRSSKVTRRRIERLLLLPPGDKAEELKNFIGYCLAYAAKYFGIRVHASVWMSNHHHTDA